MKRFIFYSAALTILFLVISCSRNDLDMEKFSGLVELEQEIAIPLLNGEINTEDIFDILDSNPLIVDNDTLKLVFGIDSISFIEDNGSEIRDTIELREEPDTTDKAYELYTGEMHYKFHNELPVGVTAMIILYDSYTDTALDTIDFSSDSHFIEPAPVDDDGVVITEEVKTIVDSVILQKSTLDNLTMFATHLILYIVAELEEPGSVNSVYIPVENKVGYHFGLYGKGSYTTNLNSDN